MSTRDSVPLNVTNWWNHTVLAGMKPYFAPWYETLLYSLAIKAKWQNIPYTAVDVCVLGKTFKADFVDKFFPAITGNGIGEDGIEEVRNWLDSKGHLDTLGSMSDDEGEGDDDDDEEEELEGGDSEDDDGDDADHLNLSVTGVSLKPQSPLLGDDEEVEKELIKVGFDLFVLVKY